MRPFKGKPQGGPFWGPFWVLFDFDTIKLLSFGENFHSTISFLLAKLFVVWFLIFDRCSMFVFFIFDWCSMFDVWFSIDVHCLMLVFWLFNDIICWCQNFWFSLGGGKWVIFDNCHSPIKTSNLTLTQTQLKSWMRHGNHQKKLHTTTTYHKLKLHEFVKFICKWSTEGFFYSGLLYFLIKNN